jgi:hypothetical protein
MNGTFWRHTFTVPEAEFPAMDAKALFWFLYGAGQLCAELKSLKYNCCLNDTRGEPV